jgi:peptide/nickel transport system ATP-binding protein
MTPLLEIQALRVTAAGSPILRGIDLSVEVGSVHGLVGESGAGKTSVGKAVLGILPSSVRVAGTLRFDGHDLLAIGERERRRILGRDIAMIPQNPMTALNPAARIEAQITDVLRLHLALPRRQARQRAHELLERVQIRQPERVLRQYPHELSGGMRQRVLIAIAFACRPKLIVADEPTTALDVTVQRQILLLLKTLQDDFETAMLFITHDLGVVAKISDVLSVMHAGRILESGATEAVFRHPHHDYTRALLAATPRYDRPGDLLRPVPAALLRRLMAEASADDGAAMP